LHLRCAIRQWATSLTAWVALVDIACPVDVDRGIHEGSGTARPH
jgi:hypothetical protein